MQITELRVGLNKEKDSDELMTHQEAIEFFKVSHQTLFHWTKIGILKSYRVGNRVYFKRSEILDMGKSNN